MYRVTYFENIGFGFKILRISGSGPVSGPKFQEYRIGLAAGDFFNTAKIDNFLPSIFTKENSALRAGFQQFMNNLYFYIVIMRGAEWKCKKISALCAESMSIIFPIRIFDPNANELSSNSVLVSLQQTL
uniref:Uncharacterized protein n=1 Tax=Romanomermis culicivorax TaxID=13658 RepID=A0A915IG99_ROMCU